MNHRVDIQICNRCITTTRSTSTGRGLIDGRRWRFRHVTDLQKENFGLELLWQNPRISIDLKKKTDPVNWLERIQGIKARQRFRLSSGDQRNVIYDLCPCTFINVFSALLTFNCTNQPLTL